MSGVAIPYRSDAECVRVNKLVLCLRLSVFLLISHPPIPSFKHTKYFLSPFLPDWPPLSLSRSLTFFILYYFPYHCLSTPVFLHTLFHQSFSPRQQQYSVRSWVFAHSTRRVNLLVQSNLVLSVGNTCHVSLSINTDNAKLHCRGHS